MAKADKGNEPLKHEVNGNIRSIIKVVEVPQGEDFQEPDGYILKDIYNSEVAGSEKFYAVMVKIQQPLQGNVSRMPATKNDPNAPVNLKKNNKQQPKPKK